MATDGQAEEIADFWRGIWGQEGTYKPEHPAIAGWKRECDNKIREGGKGAPADGTEAWVAAVKRQPNWKAPGPDWIPAFWYKAFPEQTQLLGECLWRLVDGRDQIPGWFVEGRTVLIPKAGCEGKPEQFRPITCLNNGYKAFTGALTGILMDHVQRVGVLPEEQKALRKGRRGCLDAM